MGIAPIVIDLGVIVPSSFLGFLETPHNLGGTQTPTQGPLAHSMWPMANLFHWPTGFSLCV